MTIRMVIVFGLVLIGLSGCGSTTSIARQEVKPGMTVAQVSSMLGDPANRSFRDNYEAWQYDDIVGYGQCEYITIWFRDGVVLSMTSRRGGSIAGCGLGSAAVNWDQMPVAARAGEADTQGVESHGTCFLVSSNGVAITSYHVIDGAKGISVLLADGRQVQAVVESTSAANDLAVLRLTGSTPDYLSFTSTRTARLGDQVFTVGFPAKSILGADAKFTEGSISALSGIQGEAAYMQISVPVQPGNSGGPLVNYQGNVVGVIAATAAVEAFYKATGTLPQNLNWAVKSDYVKPMIDEVAPRPIAASRDEAISRVKKAVCQVIAAH